MVFFCFRNAIDKQTGMRVTEILFNQFDWGEWTLRRPAPGSEALMNATALISMPARPSTERGHQSNVSGMPQTRFLGPATIENRENQIQVRYAVLILEARGETACFF